MSKFQINSVVLLSIALVGIVRLLGWSLDHVSLHDARLREILPELLILLLVGSALSATVASDPWKR